MKRTPVQDEIRNVGSFLRFLMSIQKQMCEKLTTFLCQCVPGAYDEKM